MSKSIKILSTKRLPQDLIIQARQGGIGIDEEPMIKIRFKQPKQFSNNLLYDALVFTSQNGVKGFRRIFDQNSFNLDAVTFFAVGNKTFEALQFLNKKIEIPEEENASSLAKAIIAGNTIKSVLFICGNQARKELPELLRQAKIKVSKLEIYETIPDPKKLNLTNYKGVMFMSPSAVESFFSVNQPPAHFTYFAIGKTTANTIIKFSPHSTVLIAEQANVASMIIKVQEHFLSTVKQ